MTDQTVTRTSWGSWKIHAVLLVCTFGAGNIVYGAYSRFYKSGERTIEHNDSLGQLDADVPYRILADLDSAARETIDEMLLDDESFILGVRSTDGVRKSRKTRWLLTDKRVIAMKEGTISENLRDIPLSKIATVEYDQGATTEVSLSGSGIDEEFYTVPAQGKAFSNALREQLMKD